MAGAQFVLGGVLMLRGGRVSFRVGRSPDCFPEGLLRWMASRERSFSFECRFLLFLSSDLKDFDILRGPSIEIESFRTCVLVHVSFRSDFVLYRYFL